jgi:hypothetical protein
VGGLERGFQSFVLFSCKKKENKEYICRPFLETVSNMKCFSGENITAGTIDNS